MSVDGSTGKCECPINKIGIMCTQENSKNLEVGMTAWYSRQ